MSLEKLINNKNLYAHYIYKNNIKINELLINHVELTKKYYNKLLIQNNSEKIIKNIIKKIDNKNSHFIYEMFSNAIIYHDLGKSNPHFQYIKMKNLNINYINSNIYNSNHSLLSSLIYNEYYNKEIFNLNINRKEKKNLLKLNLIFSYIISKHHSSLNDDIKNNECEDFISKLIELKSFILNDNYYISLLDKDFKVENNVLLNTLDFTNIDKNDFNIFFLCKYLNSLLISADYYATYDFINQESINITEGFNKEIKNNFISEFENNIIVKNTRNNIYNNKINKLRGQIFLETEKVLLSNINNGLYFLEAPTGSGKTYTSINLTLNLLKNNEELNKVFYVFPFNTLAEQTYKTLLEIFKKNSNDICKINSITPIMEKENNYNLDYLNKLFINYPFNILSHIKLFDILFGLNKESNYSFNSLANSVIVLDEIQTYKIGIWKEMINIFSYLSKAFNIKFIIISATLPTLNLIDNNDNEYVDLLPNKKYYYNNSVFKDRVKLDFSLLKEKLSIDYLVELVDKESNNNDKIIVEFQDKKNCRNFYNIIKEKNKTHIIYEITGDDNLLYRNKVINHIKEDNVKIILCTTQICEAGVDIDMDCGFKEISVLESEEQFIGRINRSCLKDNCKAYFYKLEGSKVKFIFKEDIRNSYNLNNKIIQEHFKNKTFDKYYIELLRRIEEDRNKINENNFKYFFSDMNNLLFKKIYDNMKLIDDNTYTLYIPHRKFKDIDGYKVFEEYVRILEDETMNYAKKRIELSKLNEKINLFTFTVFKSDKLVLDIETEQIKKIGSFYYIVEGDNYISSEGKLEREKLEELIKYNQSLFI